MKGNNWYVITGAPHSGKTSVIELLEKRGHKTVAEAARVYINREIAKGKTLEEIRADESLFQKNILAEKINIEKQLSPEEIVFFDRGIPDTGAYYELINFKADRQYLKVVKNCQYKKIFLFEPLPYEKDYARTESEEEQKKLHFLLLQTYKQLGFSVEVVPKMKSPDERLNFILANL